MDGDGEGSAELARDEAGWPMIRLTWASDGQPAAVMLTARQANTLGEHLIRLAAEAWALEYEDFATRDP